jgi:hypothetical protein
MAEADNPVPKRVLGKTFAVVTLCLLVPFVIAGQICAFLWQRFAPYLIFGSEATRRQNITVISSARHRIVFSNGVTIHGWRFVLMELLDVLVCLVLFASLAIVLLYIAAWVMKRTTRR